MIKLKRVTLITIILLFSLIIGVALPVPSAIVETNNLAPAVLNYNFTVGNAGIDRVMNVSTRGFDVHAMPFHTNFENASYIYNNWSTTGSPIIGNSWIPPYEGSYCAGVMVNLSGTGTHTIELLLPTDHFKWVTIDYARNTDDQGAGTPELRSKWWDGFRWHTIEYISGTNAWERTFLNVSGSGGDRNQFFKIMFEMSFPTPQDPANAVWIDDIYVNGTHVLDFEEYATSIYPVEIRNYNETHELLRYEIYIDNDLEYLNLSLNSTLVFSTQNLDIYFDTGTYGGITYFNTTSNYIRTYDNTYLFMWFFNPFLSDSYWTETTNIYPVEIIDWGTQYLYKYEFWSSNQTHNQLTMPSDDFNYQSINPNADVTAIDSQNYNITLLKENSVYEVWFTVSKPIISSGGVPYIPPTESDTTTTDDKIEPLTMPFGWLSLLGGILLLIGIFKVPVPYVKFNTLKIMGIMLIILDILIMWGS